MKKSLIAVLVAVLLVGVVGSTGAVYAQSTNPDDFVPGQGFGTRLQDQIADGSGIYHDELMATFSEALGISIVDLEARIAAGETLVEVALSEGMTFEDIKALMPVGAYGIMGENGHTGRYFFNNGETTPGTFGYGAGLQDGEYVPQYNGPQMGAGMSRGSRGGGRR